MRVNVKTDGTTDLGQPIENIERDEYLIAHSSDIDDDFSRQFMRQGSANLRNHSGLGFPQGWDLPPSLETLRATCAGASPVAIPARLP